MEMLPENKGKISNHDNSGIERVNDLGKLLIN